MAKIHRAIRIKGEVQGVFFRRETKRKADELGLGGFVRNEKDGAVYIEAEGKPSAISVFLQWCAEGPERARVKDIRSEEGPLKNFSEFLVL